MAFASRGRIAATAALLLASGCCYSFTGALWQEDEEPEFRAVVWVERSQSLDLHVGLAVTDDGGAEAGLIAWTEEGTDRDGAASWALRSLEGGDVVEMLLEDASLTSELEVRIDAACDRERGELAWGSATIELRGRLALGRLGVRTDRGRLPESTQHAIQAAEAAARDAFAGDEERTFAARRARQASVLDARMLESAETGWVVYGAVLLDGAGRPWHGTIEEAAWTASDEREALTRAQAALLATNGSESAVWLLPAELAVLAGKLRVGDDGSFEHRSTWSFAATPARRDLVPVGGAGLVWPMHLVERDLVHGLAEEERMSFGEKLAWTPLTLLADGAVGWLLHLLGLPSCDCDDDDDDGE